MGSMVVRCRLAARGGGLKLLSLSFHTEPVGGLDKFASGHPGDQITRGSGSLAGVTLTLVVAIDATHQHDPDHDP